MMTVPTACSTPQLIIKKLRYRAYSRKFGISTAQRFAVPLFMNCLAATILNAESTNRFQPAIEILTQIPIAITEQSEERMSSVEILAQAENEIYKLRNYYQENLTDRDKAALSLGNNYVSVLNYWPDQNYDPIYNCIVLAEEFSSPEIHLKLTNILISPLIEALNNENATFIEYGRVAKIVGKLWEGYRWVPNLDDTTRSNEWNSRCIAEFAIDQSWRINPQHQPATFSKTIAGEVLVVGRISQGYASELYSAIHGQVLWGRSVNIGNGWGGDVHEAMRAGRVIRYANFDTRLYGDCVSACAIAFLGGYARTADFHPGVRIGFHKISDAQGNAVPTNSAIYSQVSSYLTEMGLEPSVIIAFMMRAEPDEMYYPTQQELCASGVLFGSDC